MKGIEGKPDRTKVVYSAGYDGTHPRSDRSKCIVVTNVQRQDPGPGGHRGEQGVSGGVEGKRWSNGDGVETDVRQC